MKKRHAATAQKPSQSIDKKPWIPINLVMVTGMRNAIALSRGFGVPIFVYEGMKPFLFECDSDKGAFSKHCEFNGFCILACTFLGSALLYSLDVLLLSVETRMKGIDPDALKLELQIAGLDKQTQLKLLEAQQKGTLKISVALA